MAPLKLTVTVPLALAFLVGQTAMQGALAQPGMDMPAVPTLHPTVSFQPTAPTVSPTKQPTLTPTCSGNKGKCERADNPYELGFALGMVGVLVSARVPGWGHISAVAHRPCDDRLSYHTPCPPARMRTCTRAHAHIRTPSHTLPSPSVLYRVPYFGHRPAIQKQ